MNLNYEALQEFLNENYDFQYNQVNNQLYYKTKFEEEFLEMKDFELNTVLREVKNGGFSNAQKKDIVEILNSSFTKVYNPFKEYFKGLNNWNVGDYDYIEALSDTVSVDPTENNNWKNWLKKWLVGVVACAIDDKAINQTALIFTGAQAVGKTTWLLNLVPKSLSEYYFGGVINLGNKDTEIQLAENLIINLDEMENMKLKNIATFKQIITKPSIKIRRPYATVSETMPRRASFVGSTNKKEFLVDSTGNRRYLTFETIKIQFNHSVNMNDVYAQAYSLYNSGFQYWFDDAEIALVNKHNSSYNEISLDQEILEGLFVACPANTIPELELETSALLEHIFSKSPIAKRLSPRTLGQTLNRLNWPKRKTMGRRYWLLNERK